MTRKIQIPRQTLKRLYHEEHQSQREIAELFGCSETTVARRLREYGMPTRRNRVQYGAHSKRSRPRCQWTPDLAYAVGLITSDGSLSGDGRHIIFTSVDYELIETFKQCLGLRNRIALAPPGGYSKQPVYRVQFSHTAFYDWLLEIGLMPNKTSALSELTIPDEHLADLLRGYLDGDGCIQTYVDTYNRFKSEKYIYQRLFVRFFSGSRGFLEWLKSRLRQLMGTRGAILHHSGAWELRFAKKDSLRLLHWMYYSPDVPCLGRKRDIAEPFLTDVT
jgi:TyrR family helix-turn-helix protein